MDQMNNKLPIFYNRSQDFLQVRLDEQKFPRLRNISPDEAFQQVKGMVIGAAILRGTALPDSVINTTTEAFLQEARQDFPEITLPEIGKAIRNGCFEKYGQVYGINAVSLYKMLEGYQDSRETQTLRMREQAERSKQAEKTREWLREHPNYYNPQ